MIATAASIDMVLQCEWAQVQVIVLTNDGNGFGFGISGSRNSGAVVRNIFPGGAADKVIVYFLSPLNLVDIILETSFSPRFDAAAISNKQSKQVAALERTNEFSAYLKMMIMLI